MTREDIFKLLNKHQDNDTLDIKTAKEMVNIIFDEHEAQVQAKDDEIRRLNNLYADTIKDLGEALMEIDRLKKLVNSMNNTYSVGDFDFESYYAITNNFE